VLDWTNFASASGEDVEFTTRDFRKLAAGSKSTKVSIDRIGGVTIFSGVRQIAL